MPPQIICASALPGKMGKHESFHSNAALVLLCNVHCQKSTCRWL